MGHDDDATMDFGDAAVGNIFDSGLFEHSMILTESMLRITGSDDWTI